MKLVNFRSDCRVCKSRDLNEIIDLGSMPLAGNFVKKRDLKKKRD